MSESGKSSQGKKNLRSVSASEVPAKKELDPRRPTRRRSELTVGKAWGKETIDVDPKDSNSKDPTNDRASPSGSSRSSEVGRRKLSVDSYDQLWPVTETPEPKPKEKAASKSCDSSPVEKAMEKKEKVKASKSSDSSLNKTAFSEASRSYSDIAAVGSRALPSASVEETRIFHRLELTIPAPVTLDSSTIHLTLNNRPNGTSLELNDFPFKSFYLNGRLYQLP